MDRSDYMFIYIMIVVSILTLILIAFLVLSYSPTEYFAESFDKCMALERFTREECIVYASERVG